MKKRLLVLVLLFGLVLTGCEKRGPNPGDPAAVAGGTPGSIARLQIWTTEAPDFFTALAREYVASIGATSLRFKVVNFDDSAQLQSFLLDAMAAGEGPDVVYVDGAWVASNIDKLIPVTADDSSFTVANFQNTFVQSAQSLLIQAGQIWGVPLGVDSLALFYNDAHIQDRLPDRNLPGRTWSEFQEDVIALTKTDNSFSRFAFSAAALGRLDNVTYGFEILQNIFLQSNAPWFSADGQEAVFDKTTGLINGRNENLGEKALDFFTSFADDRFRHYTWNEFVAGSQPLADYTEFLKGNISMVFGFTRDYERLKALRQQIQQNRQTVIPEGDIRVTFLPQFTDPSLPTRQVIGKVHSLAVSKHSQYPDTAWGFLKFAIGKDQLQAWHEKTQLPTPRVDLLVEQEATPYIGIFVRQAKFAEGGVYPVSTEDLKDELTQSVNQIQDRKWTVLQGLQKAAANLNKDLQSRVRKQREIER